MRRFLDFAGDAVLVAHNARFDLGFLDVEVERLTGRRVAAPVVDTVWLARRLLEGRTRRVGLASLAHFFGTSARPCHRALPDAEATAEALAAPDRAGAGARGADGRRPRRPFRAAGAAAARRRSLAAGAPQRPGVYLFRDRHEQVLYVGRARDLKARLRSYFRGERQRPAVEAALGALARIEWRVLGSELEAALEELRLIRELRPPANARGGRADRWSYLRRRGTEWVAGSQPSPYGPIRSRGLAQKAARALGSWDGEPDDALPAVRGRMRRLARQQRFEDAARLRDRLGALERVVRDLAELERLRALEVCLVVPAAEEGYVRAHFLRGGRIAAVRTLPAGAGGLLEAELGLASVAAIEPSRDADHAEELLLVATFLRRPPPELRVVPLRAEAIVRAA